MSVLYEKLKEVLMSVLPVFVMVLLIHFIFVPMPVYLVMRFIIGTALIIIGLTLFLVGVDLGITPLGSYIGERVVKMNKLWVIIVVGLVLGFVITVAEPGLLVYAQQIERITNGLVPSFLLFQLVLQDC